MLQLTKEIKKTLLSIHSSLNGIKIYYKKYKIKEFFSSFLMNKKCFFLKWCSIFKCFCIKKWVELDVFKIKKGREVRSRKLLFLLYETRFYLKINNLGLELVWM